MFSPKEIKDVAQQALNYARSYIIKSSTELSINQYELSRRLSISQGVAEVRLLMKELTSSVVELNYNIIFFYNSIELSKNIL